PSSRLSGELVTIIDAACLAASQGQDHLASLCVPSSGEHDLLLTVCALPHAHDLEAGTPQAAIFISDPSRRPKVSGTILSELFGLTPSEADVACALANGRRTTEIATDLSISSTTVAFHLRNVSVKTGTHRQADLIALIRAALASIAAPEAGASR